MDNLPAEQNKQLTRSFRRAELKQKIAELYFVKHWPLITLVQELRVSPDVLNKYIDEVQEELMAREKEDIKREEIICEHLTQKSKLNKCWELLDTTQSEYVKIKALELVDDFGVNHIDNLQKLGVIDKPSVKSEVTHKMDFESMMVKWREMRKRETVDAIDVTPKEAENDYYS